jgi:hypothetical protein
VLVFKSENHHSRLAKRKNVFNSSITSESGQLGVGFADFHSSKNNLDPQPRQVLPITYANKASELKL